MRNPNRLVHRWVCSLALLAAIVVGVVALTTGPAVAGPGRPGLPGPPGPLCGWSTLWDCTLPDGSVVQIGGTQCDIAKFERKTGATCVPAQF